MPASSTNNEGVGFPSTAFDNVRERIESAYYFFPDAAGACRFQSHIKKSGRGKLPWRYRWPDETRDDILARLLALNAQRAELERLTGLPATAASPAAPKAKRARKASKRATKKSARRPMFDEDEQQRRVPRNTSP